MSTKKTQSLVISAIGDDKPGLVEKLAATIMDAGCSIVDSRMVALGGEFAVLILVAGPWNALAKLEQKLPETETRLSLTLQARRTDKPEPAKNLLPYAVEVVALDQPGIVYNLANFFASRGINISEVATTGYAAPHTGTPMFAANMHVHIPADMKVANIREEFMLFCDGMNLDAVIEPAK